MSIDVFISYSHKDKELCDKLLDHLSNMKQQGLIQTWYDGDITGGSERERRILDQLNSAQIILLLISSDFLASSFCYSVQMEQAIARHEAHQARVLPIIVRPVDWSGAPFAVLQMLPSDAKPVTEWESQDRAFTDIVQGIRRAIVELTAPVTPAPGASVTITTVSDGMPEALESAIGVQNSARLLMKKQVQLQETEERLNSLLTQAYALNSSLVDLKQQLDDGDLDEARYLKMEAKQKRLRADILQKVREELAGYDENLDTLIQDAITGGQGERALMDRLAQVAQQRELSPALIDSLTLHRGSFLSWLIEVGKQIIKQADRS